MAKPHSSEASEGESVRASEGSALLEDAPACASADGSAPSASTAPSACTARAVPPAFAARASDHVPWYVVQVQTGGENKARALIERSCGEDVLAECFVPQYAIQKRFRGEWQSRTEVLFPGYLMAVSPCVDKLEHRLRGVSAFTRLLGNELAFIPLNKEERAWISAFTQKGDRVMDTSLGVVEGDRITILQGPLMGHEAWIKSVNRHKRTAYLEMEMFGRTIKTKVGLSIVRKLP